MMSASQPAISDSDGLVTPRRIDGASSITAFRVERETPCDGIPHLLYYTLAPSRVRRMIIAGNPVLVGSQILHAEEPLIIGPDPLHLQSHRCCELGEFVQPILA